MAKQQNENESKPVLKTNAQVAGSFLELFKDGISDLYWAENHLVKTLPKMISAASSAKLKKIIEAHLEETKSQVSRLQAVFEHLGEKPIAKKCDAMEGLTKEAEGIVEETRARTQSRDLGIILGAQKVEHYEIASYTGLHLLALQLGLSKVADLLSQTLDEEKKADSNLAAFAENEINYKAD